MKLLLVPILLAGLSATSVAAHESVKSRKSLGFGPVHPHAVFNSDPSGIPQSFGGLQSKNPFQLAQNFANGLIPPHLDDASAFVLRKDSYTDRNTGVTHIYFRQFLNGLEVADGDLNVNVKDGIILSYGNSAYQGDAPDGNPVQTSTHPHSDYCSQLANEFDARNAHFKRQFGEQTIVDELAFYRDTILRPLEHMFESSCTFTDLPDKFLSKDHKLEDPRHALLQFMIAATPEQHMVQDILSKYDDYINDMTSYMDTHFVGGETHLPVELISNVPDTVNPVKARLAYIQVPDGDSTHLDLVWKFEVEMKDNWYEAAVSAHAPHKIISVVDWASDAYAPIPRKERGLATYNVFKWGINDPSEGNRSIETEYNDKLASPLGWHSLPIANDPYSGDTRFAYSSSLRNTTVTWGNNVFAHENWDGRNSYIENYRPDGGESLEFDYVYNPKFVPGGDALEEARKYINTTITQLFYTTNMVHDLYYRYGFDEASGNFQQHNFGRGGEENDGVIANAQDGSGFNNANFMTPPDGQNGRCRMYIWKTATPYRDGDLEAGIVIHELTHGMSTRLTGGPANSGCLGWGESGGMGEGWGDFLATTIRSTSNYSDYSMGAWAANLDGGIRNFVYSTDIKVNPSTYKTLDKPGYWGVHAIGEVWAEILWVVSNKLIEKYGFSDTLFPPLIEEDGTIPTGDFYRPREHEADGSPKPLIPKHGNTLVVQLVVNGMKLQPCRPSFLEARDAIIQADQILTGGENHCALWEGFSERGLGPDARVDGRTPWGGGIRTDDFELPSACQ
jgi:extracellular elastinolytic metalloproteinase